MNDPTMGLLILGWQGFFAFLGLLVFGMPERLARLCLALLLAAWLWIAFGGLERWTS